MPYLTLKNRFCYILYKTIPSRFFVFLYFKRAFFRSPYSKKLAQICTSSKRQRGYKLILIYLCRPDLSELKDKREPKLRRWVIFSTEIRRTLPYIFEKNISRKQIRFSFDRLCSLLGLCEELPCSLGECLSETCVTSFACRTPSYSFSQSRKRPPRFPTAVCVYLIIGNYLTIN